MPFTKTTKIYLFICLSWVAVFFICSCAPVFNLQKSAQQGDVRSQVLVGEQYEFGAGVTADQTTAAQWYQLAAKQDNPEAQYYLGVMYERGVGLSRNVAEAMEWLFKSGEQGYEKAQILLAVVYIKDRGFRQEFLKKIEKYKQSAEKGNAVAQYTLGWIYREGAGVPVNYREAMKWYHRAAERGNVKAQFALGNIYLDGKVAKANPNEALAWFRKSAETETQARVKLCELYKGAAGLPQSAQEAKNCSKALAENTDDSLRAYINMQHAILDSEKEEHPAMALRACRRLAEVDPAYNKVSDTCDSLKQFNSAKMNLGIQETRSVLEQKDWDRFRDLVSWHITPDFDEWQWRWLVISAWRLIEEETRDKERIVKKQLRSIETANRSASYRKQNAHQISKLISTFKAIVAQGLRDNPGDADLIALAREGEKIIASIQQKMKQPQTVIEKPVMDTRGKDVEPGEDDFKNAKALFDSGRFEEAASFFEKTTKIRGFKNIASAYIYLGISHLARINSADINEARKLRLKGVSCFQNALRFERGIGLPAGYDKYQPVFDEAKERLR